MTERTRKHQIAEFLRALKLPPSYRRAVAKALRDAAMVGACEERSHCLAILRADPTPPIAAMNRICERSVLAVLGYEEA